jgi:hypothetical protein
VPTYQDYFGAKFATYESRKESYNLIEEFISTRITDWSTAPDTDKMTDEFSQFIKGMDNEDFAFLVFHAGYIPEEYEHDSSQETLYSKLIEALVCEWAIRIGFTDSVLVKQKSSMEDVTIAGAEGVIVADAKSFRLGRSQSAPNVKDTIKQADYAKWQKAHITKNHTCLGGIITFPELHNWSKASDAYLYTSDKQAPILLMFYHVMAFCLIREDIDSASVAHVFEEFGNIFPTTTKDASGYHASVNAVLFKDCPAELAEFIAFYDDNISEKVDENIKRIDLLISEKTKMVTDRISQVPDEEIRARLITMETNHLTSELHRNLLNIKKFRPHTL